MLENDVVVIIMIDDGLMLIISIKDIIISRVSVGNLAKEVKTGFDYRIPVELASSRVELEIGMLGYGAKLRGKYYVYSNLFCPTKNAIYPFVNLNPFEDDL